MQDISTKNPICSTPFECFFQGSWHGTEFVSIINGKTFACIHQQGSAVEKVICWDSIRLRSRKANVCDCRHLLKVGADVCVLSSCWISDSSDLKSQQPLQLPMWYDAKIVSTKHSDHESGCSCFFSVIVYKKRAIDDHRKSRPYDRAETVTIDKIAILQKLNYKLTVDGLYQWSFSEDCITFKRSKLLSGAVSSQISWLVLLSVLKGIHFRIKSVQGNILYQILEKDQKSADCCKAFSLKPDAVLITMHFKQLLEYSRPVVKTHCLFGLRSVDAERYLSVGSELEEKVIAGMDSESDIEVLYDKKSLRRSKRQKIKPDWFTGQSFSEICVKKKHWARDKDRLDNIKVKQQNLQHNLLTSFLSTDFDELNHNIKSNKAQATNQLVHKEQKHLISGSAECAAAMQNFVCKTLADENENAEGRSQNPLKMDSEEICEEHPTKSQDRQKEHGANSLIQSDCLITYSTNLTCKSKRNRATDVVQLEHKNQKQFASLDNLEFVREKESSSSDECAEPSQILPRKKSLDENVEKEIFDEHPSKPQNRLEEHGLGDMIQPDHFNSNLLKNFDYKSKTNMEADVDQLEHRNWERLPCDEQCLDTSEFSHEKKSSGNLEYAMPCRLNVKKNCDKHTTKSPDRLKDHGFGEGMPRSRTRLRDKEGLCSYSSNFLAHKKFSCRKKLLSPLECKEFIQECMDNIKAEMESEFLQNAQPKKILPDEIEDFIWPTTPKDQIVVEENNEIWKEMEHLLTQLALQGQDQDLDSKSFGGILFECEEASVEMCKHDFKLDEQVGIICRFCNFVHTDVRDILPPFMMPDVRNLCNGYRGKEGFPEIKSYIFGLSTLGSDIASFNLTSFGGSDTIWDLIPELRLRLYEHQKKAFEFIWKNVAGSLNPKDMDFQSGSTGGCILSHTPGSGKTFLLISFIISYLTLFPKSRPLVLAPKIAICVWRKEFEKWNVQFPLHIIHPIDSYRQETLDCKARVSVMNQRKPNMKMSHVMDCLMKLKKWHEESSILLMSYSSFALMQKESTHEHRKFMAKVLKESPTLLILDEGHNPRSTLSKLRNLLMDMKTQFRILLSGTLFQNNFEEYFNTLCLARPSFVNDVLREFEPDILAMTSQRKKSGKRSKGNEKLARKIFVQRVGEKISSSIEGDRKHGFHVLHKITSGFIDVYQDDNSRRLPMLQIYTVVLMPTDIQLEILARLHSRLKQAAGHPIALEILISLGSIHPWLVSTMAHANKFYSDSDLKNIEKLKENIMSGSKMKFIFDVVHKASAKGEKVLIFSRNISPINLLVAFFENLLGWSKGNEVLVLQGEQELSLRSKIMDKFNGDVGNKCKLLIASTSACAEGISLTAASRVVLLDSEWNPSKTRQAIARAFRPGQEREVYVYKLLASGTWEEEKYRSNEWKAWLSNMIFTGQYINYTSSRKVDFVEDTILRELIEEEHGNMFKLIMKQD